ncbi:MAG: hypothetical protein GY854_14385 [Deltaproteobacteria bacterium]|nr:hypothetical protein [Deltaproteobacteria bacterium]
MTDSMGDGLSEVNGGKLSLELDHLYRFVGAVGSNLDVDTLADDALSPLLTMGRGNKVLIVIINDQNDNTIIKQRGWPSLTTITFKSRDIADLGLEAIGYGSSEEVPAPFGELLGKEPGSWAIIPLAAYGRQLGLVMVGREDEPFNASTLKLLNTAGRQLAMAVENSRLFGDLQQSYQRLMDAQEELIQSERLAALGGLAATMAHEIRNPLATIFSSLSQIRKHAQITGDSATLLEIAEEEAIRLNRMVGGLLEFARPRIPRIEEVQPLDIVNEVIEGVVGNPEFQKGVELSATVIGKDKDFVARLDPELFRRAVLHLVNNGVAAVESGEGKVSVELQAGKGEDEEMSLAVVDNGCGISPGIRHNAFEPFFSTQPSGIGLGLPVVKRIAEDHRGSIVIDSKPGEGTRVQLLFRPNPRSSMDSPEKRDEQKGKI